MGSEARRLSTEHGAGRPPGGVRRLAWGALALAVAAAWWLAYTNLEHFANWVVYAVLGMTAGCLVFVLPWVLQRLAGAVQSAFEDRTRAFLEKKS